MDDPGCLRASPDPHHVNRCDRPSTRFHAGHCGGRGVPRGSRPQPGLFRSQVSWWRALRAWGTPGRIRPGADMSPRATDWQLHAREPLVPAQCGDSHRQRSLPAAWGHATLSEATRLSRSAPLPVRHPGPRVTAAGRYTPAPSGLATTASQSGQRHASYHPPRLIMSAARDKMLSTPCRARLRAARHYRFRATGRQAAGGAIGRFRPPAGSDGLAPRTSRPTNTATARIIVSPARITAMPGRRGPPARGTLRLLPAAIRRTRVAPPGPSARTATIQRRQRRPAELRCVAAMPTNPLRTSFAPTTSTRRAPGPPPAGLPHRSRPR